MQKIRPYLILPLVVLTICFAGEADSSQQNISFALVGDIMLGTDYPDSTRLPMLDGLELFTQAMPFLIEADIAIGNLEGPLTTIEKCTKTSRDGRVYAFRMPPALAPRLKDAGFDVLITANNHARDFGLAGRIETENILDSLGIEHTGRIGEIAVLHAKGSKIAVIGFCTSPGSYSLFDIDAAAALVDSLDRVYDIVVVSFHGGAEGAKYAHLPDSMETFLGEDRGELKKFAHSVIDAGADIVYGHGPHVPRAVEQYKDRVILYSLGNFCTWWGISVSGSNGYAPMAWVELAPSGELVDFKIISFEQRSKHYPVYDSQERAAKFMLELSMSDVVNFPDGLKLSASSKPEIKPEESSSSNKLPIDTKVENDENISATN